MKQSDDREQLYRGVTTVPLTHEMRTIGVMVFAGDGPVWRAYRGETPAMYGGMAQECNEFH